MKSLTGFVIAGVLVGSGLTGCQSEPERKGEPAAAARAAMDPGPPQTPAGDRYIVDASASRFQAQVGVAGLLSAFGHEHTIALREFSGEAYATAGALDRGSLRLTIRASSLAEVAPGFSEADRKKIDRDVRDKALEVSRFPEITFRSTGLTMKESGDGPAELEIRGELTLHGVTRSVTFPARVELQNDLLTAHGEFTVRHSDYNIERLSAAAGTVKAADDIRLTFEIVARKS
jgi:polyisoprenoid-binding protein YceI